jgi:hypothetical protein
VQGKYARKSIQYQLTRAYQPDNRWFPRQRRGNLPKLTMKNLYFIFLILLISGCTNNFDACYSTDSSNVDGLPLTRSQVVLTADKYARVHWFMSKVNEKGISCGKNFTSDYSIGPRVGMGYKFGGWDSIDVFLSKIAEGYGTGTGIETYKTIPFDCVTGISCTGFVSRAWQLNHKYTLIYPNQPDVPRQFNEITRIVKNVNFLFQRTTNLRKGDAFLNQSHMILFLYENRDGNPMILHSSVEGVRFEEKSWFELWLHGYIPIRYNNIKDDNNPSGTINNPIVIDSDDFPYVHNGNTRNVVSMEFDRYSAAQSINQQGPETIYKLSINSSGTINIQITDCKNEGIDNDIHLLFSLKKSVKSEALDCFAREDRLIEMYLDAGTYYIVVDSKKDLPGEYRLIVKNIGK